MEKLYTVSKNKTRYAIERIYTSPDGKGFVFVVEKTVEDAAGTSIRYMVETVVPPVSNQSKTVAQSSVEKKS